MNRRAFIGGLAALVPAAAIAEERTQCDGIGDFEAALNAASEAYDARMNARPDIYGIEDALDIPGDGWAVVLDDARRYLADVKALDPPPALLQLWTMELAQTATLVAWADAAQRLSYPAAMQMYDPAWDALATAREYALGAALTSCPVWSDGNGA